MMYLVTIEDEEGMWFQDPNGFDTLAEARKYFNDWLGEGAESIVIYECRQIDFRGATKEI